jgi:hypothetical protein
MILKDLLRERKVFLPNNIFPNDIFTPKNYLSKVQGPMFQNFFPRTNG